MHDSGANLFGFSPTRVSIKVVVRGLVTWPGQGTLPFAVAGTARLELVVPSDSQYGHCDAQNRNYAVGRLSEHSGTESDGSVRMGLIFDLRVS